MPELAKSCTAPLRLTVITATQLSWPLITQVADLTRAAYVDSDPLPGLPAPDGANEGAESIAAFVTQGGSIWVAKDASDNPVGALRTGRCNDGALFVSRVAVAPDRRKFGVGRWLLAAVEEQAAADEEPVLRLDAVIERCVPPYYARLGYHAAEHHLAQDDKLLTEVAMERDPRASRTPQPSYPLTRIDAHVTGTLTWFLLTDGLAAVSREGTHNLASAVAHGLHVLGDHGALLAGVDTWRGHDGDLGGLFTGLPGAMSCPGGMACRGLGPRHAVPLHLMPRAGHRDLWAALRPLPGTEPPAWQLAGQR